MKKFLLRAISLVLAFIGLFACGVALLCMVLSDWLDGENEIEAEEWADVIG